MSAKIWIVSLVFISWISISWKWYTCDINGLCVEEDSASASYVPRIEPAIDLESSPSSDLVVNEVVPHDLERLKRERELSSQLPITFTFIYNSTTSYWRQKSRNEMESLCKNLNDAGLTIEITGHSDAHGEARNALDLGLRRATAAMDYLVDCGCNESHISTLSKGDQEPLNSGSNVNERAKNRRVEIHLSNHQ